MLDDVVSGMQDHQSTKTAQLRAPLSGVVHRHNCFEFGENSSAFTRVQALAFRCDAVLFPCRDNFPYAPAAKSAYLGNALFQVRIIHD